MWCYQFNCWWVNTNSKIIIIDLPEANFLSSYYLLKNFPKKRLLLYCDLNDNILSKEIIKDYDIVIVPPWIKFKNLTVDIYTNVRSFMEMDFEVIKYYFEMI